MTTWDDLDGAEEPWDGMGLSGDLHPDSGAEQLEPEVEAVVPTGMVGDPTETVHIGTDDEHRVVQVMVSNNWRNRLKSAELGRVIVDTAQQATAELSLGTPQIGQFSLFGGREPHARGGDASYPMSQIEVNQLLEETLQTMERQRELDERDDVRERRIDFTEAVGASDNEKVQVVLGPTMQPERVSIDERWVAGVRAERLIQGLEQAFARAYEKWQPPVVVPGEHDELLDGLDTLKKKTLRPVLIAGGWISEDEEL